MTLSNTCIPKARKLNFILQKIYFAVELLLVINLRVETLIQSGRCQLSAPSMHKVKSGVQNMYMYIAKNFLHEGATVFTCCCVQVEFLSNHNCKVCTRGKFTQCYTCHCNSGNIIVGCLRRLHVSGSFF